MADIKRMKFAYARGARVQARFQKDAEFQTLMGAPLWRPAGEYRIHPDDARLEYGPLSNDLRRRAIEQDFEGVVIDYWNDIVKLPVWEGIWIHTDMRDELFRATGADGRMFMLFIAELLADEGM